MVHLFTGVHQTQTMWVSFSVMELIFDSNMRFTLVIWDINLLVPLLVCHSLLLSNDQVIYGLNHFVKGVYQWVLKKRFRAWYTIISWQVNWGYFTASSDPNNEISWTNVKIVLFLYTELPLAIRSKTHKIIEKFIFGSSFQTSGSLINWINIS